MTRRHAGVRTALGGLVLGLAGAASGCSALDDRAEGAGTPAVDPSSALDLGVRTLTWGLLDQTASVVVRNDTDLALRRGRAVVRAVDREGHTLATSATMSDQDACCAAVDVAPGATVGFSSGVGGVATRSTTSRWTGPPSPGWSRATSPR